VKAPPDIQVSSILYFLGQALRQDADIQRWTNARPEEIVAKTVEYEPIAKDRGNKYQVYVSQLPALCLHITSARPKIVAGTKRGREFTAMLWYLFKPFQAESREMHGFTKGDRLKSLIWWRIQHYLMYQRLPIDDGYTFDLQAVSKIRTLEMDGETEWLAFDSVEGIKIPLKCWHGWAPYEEIDPTILELVTLGITSEAGSGVGVNANVDVSAP
jgi:hypothetical protein